MKHLAMGTNNYYSYVVINMYIIKVIHVLVLQQHDLVKD